MKMYECEIVIKLNPRRKANSREEFIKNLVKEYNEAESTSTLESFDLTLDVLNPEDIINIREDV